MEREAPFGELLKELRKRHRIGQKELAASLGVHRNTIGAWERGDRLPDTRGMVLEMAKQLHLNEEETQALLEASLTSVALRWYLPYSRNPFFVGREQQLECLYTALVQKAPQARRPYALSGMGGMGKTQLAIEFAYRYTQQFSAVLWIGAETQESIISHLTAIASVLNLPQQRDQNQHTLIASVLQWFQTHRDWLLIFDNVEDLEFVQPYMPTLSHGALLLTTRLQATGELAQPLEVEPMTPDEGAHFLLQRARISGPFSPETMQAANAIVASSGGLPLALDQAGAYIEETNCSLPEYQRLFHSHTLSLLSERAIYASHPHSIVKTLMLSFSQLQQREPSALLILSACAFLAPEAIPEAIFTGAPASVLGETLASIATDAFHWNRGLRALQHFSLVKRNGQQRLLSLHRLVQLIFKEGISHADQRHWVMQLLRLLHHAFPQVETKPEFREQWRWCDLLLPHARECIKQSQHWELAGSDVTAFYERIAAYLFYRARYTEAEPLMLETLELYKASSNEEAQAALLARLGRLYHHLEQRDRSETCYLQAIEMQERLSGSDSVTVADTLELLALLYTNAGRFAEAEQHLRRALHIKEALYGPDHPSQARALHYLAAQLKEQGRYQEAETLMLRALHLYELEGGVDSLQVASLVHSLAIACAEQGKYSQIEPLLQRALHLQEAVLGPNHPTIGRTLGDLATLYCVQNMLADALPLFRRAIRIFEQTHGPDYPEIAYFLTNLATAYKELGNYAEAEPLFHRAIVLREQALGPNHPQVAFPLQNLAEVYILQERYNEAEPLLQRVLSLREAVGTNHPQVAFPLDSLAELYIKQGSIEKAKPLVERALRIREQLGPEHPDLATTLLLQAEISAEEEAKEEARQLLKRALHIREQIFGPDHPLTQQARSRSQALLDNSKLTRSDS
ncbi:DNA-binding XRE family transcriptional regulator [Thermosporothrix hazakensis]|jgi:tetratricopeptide (TPR) repeat protein/transcriptional regulator with XRE-family HTH domain|uniref:DNA-binding XRE family transcriptional regulator n=1 Tax=Thermosporothrix hazakensis TaxID=644383 RepID=A0A326U5V2_THEHA|nr:FxSxx-COOH system tetratricopeptide repeat protein [Thermosporothrix hazakensis]PZW28074.1 DNA-binding XRE family transcriptional regulator [Thermosporothrix hazakensis]GCE51295.1 tetratricopeptide repeat protein [Thermosporothrix hazakensis]